MVVAIDMLTRGSRAMDTFEKTPHALMAQVRDGTLTKGDLFAYITICEIAFVQGGEVNLPQQQLADAVACQPRMLRYHLTALLNAGWIAARKLGIGHACAYRPTRPADRASGNLLPLAPDGGSSERQPVAAQVATRLPVERQHIATVNRQTPEDPVKTDIRSTPEGASPAPAPARETDRSMLSLDGPPRPVPKPRPLPVEPSPEPPPPPPPPRRPAAARGQRPRTEPPETLEPTPAQREWALGHGFTEATLAAEVERCLDHHRIEAKTSANWHASLRTWLTNEAAWAAADGRQPGVRLGKARPKVPATGRDYRETSRGRLPQQPAYTASAGAPNDPQVLESIRQRAKGW